MEGCYLIDFNSIGDEHIGYLTALEENKDIPFDIKRVYYTYNVPQDVNRGFHAHRDLQQVLICLNGSLKVKCFNGIEEEIYTLNLPNKGLYLNSMIWREMFDYEENTVLMVLASKFYDSSDYIRDYDKFLEIVNENKNNKDYFVHEKAIVDTDNIGVKTKVWGFSHIFSKAIIGENCNICEHVLIENDVLIKNNVTIKSGVYIWDGVTIDDNVFIGPCVSFTNDKHPRSKQYPDEFEKTYIKENASIGANSTIMCGVIIGECATVGAGSVVLKNVNPYEVVVGNPAKLIGYNCKCSKKLDFKDSNISKCECGLIYEKKDNIVRRI